jgi:prevent-host-death family protein
LYNIGMITITTSEARKQLSEIVSRVAYGHERVILHRNGKSLAAMVSMADLRTIEASDKLSETGTATPLKRLDHTTINTFPGGTVMAHTREPKKEEKKAATKSIKERRAEKKAKKAARVGF